MEVSRAQSTYFVWFIHKKEPSGLRANKKQNKSPYLLLREPSRPSNSSQASPPLETSDKCTGDSHSTAKYGKGLLAISIPVFCFGDPPLPALLLSFEVGQLLQTGRSSSTAFSDAGQ